MKKVLVTGTCGFILGNFIRKACYEQNQKKPEDKYTFASVDCVNANALNTYYYNKNHAFYPADIRDAHILDIIFQYEKPDIVIHGAAATGVDASLLDTSSFITSNVLGTQNTINACIKHKVKRLIYVSTEQVYGQLTGDQDPSWTEEAPLLPRNPYAATKAAGELLVKAANQSYGLIYNITRGSSCYGKLQAPQKLLPKAIKCILNGEKIFLYGQGQQIRSWTYVNDKCSALMAILERGLPNETYNISSKQEFSNLEAINLVCNTMNAGYDLIDFVEDPRNGGYGHDFRYSMDTDKLQKLGWKPSYKFKDGIKDTVQWYIDNQWFLK